MSQTNQNGRPDGGSGAVRVEVTVRDWRGQAIKAQATVVLKAGGQTYSLTRDTATDVYAGFVPPGNYDLAASTDEHVSSPRSVTVSSSPKTVVAYVGGRDWPFYRLGENAVPFQAPGPFLAVAFPDRKPDPDEARDLNARLEKELPLKAAPPEKSTQEEGYGGDMPAEGAIWVYRITRKDTPRLRADLHEKIREIVGERGRVGVPVDLEPGRSAVIDNRFVLRFRNEIDEGEVDRHLAEVNATTLRRLRQARNARLVEFPAGDFAKHLEQVENLHKAGVLIYGEPDIMAELTDDAFPDDAPNDPTFGNQDNLTLQNVDLAWRMLDATDPLRTLGSADVIVASLDRGLDTDHPDIGGMLTDGSPQVLRCFDFSGLRECTVPGYAPDTSHGMGVYGIIAALTNNGEDVAGIAPNTRQIVMERPSLTSVNYPDVLLWAAGFATGNLSPGWPAEPLLEGADIISCSHGRDGLALSGIMDDTFQTLANSGRGGLGTIVVYSAGNSNNLITGFRTWAAHPDTLSVANSLQPDGSGVERKVGTSNFGPEIDVCAQGAGAPSLNDTGGEQTFGGTSAAAPTVAAAAALMLSANPVLRREEIRDIMRDTAVKIDPNNVNATGRWRDINGLISTAPGYLGPNFSQFYGFGRLDVAGAVEEAGWRLSLIIADQGEYGNVCVGSFKDMTLTLSNSGANTIPITGISSSSPDFVVPNILGLPLTIKPGNSLEVPIRFRPGSFGSKQATITVDSAPYSARMIEVTGMARPPKLDLIIVSAGIFGDVCVGSGFDKPLGLLNSGPCPLTVTGISSSSAEFLVANVLSFPLTIASGTAIEVPIRFQPVDFGSKSGAITVTSDDPLGPKMISVSGEAPSPRLASAIANEGDFGKTCVGDFTDRMVTLSNSARCPLTLQSIVSDSAEFVLPSVLFFPIIIGAGDSLQIPIRFQPSSFGPKAGTVTITSDDPLGPKVLHVTGTAPSGRLSITGSTCIGGVKECCLGEQTLTLANTGDCPLHVAHVGLARPSKYWKLVNNPFPAKLHPGASLDILIRYKAEERCPRAQGLVIKTDDPECPEKFLDLLAYTVWQKAPKQDCGDCGCSECCCDRGCTPQSLDACCFDENCAGEADAC